MLRSVRNLATGLVLVQVRCEVHLHMPLNWELLIDPERSKSHLVNELEGDPKFELPTDFTHTMLH